MSDATKPTNDPALEALLALVMGWVSTSSDDKGARVLLAAKVFARAAKLQGAEPILRELAHAVDGRVVMKEWHPEPQA